MDAPGRKVALVTGASRRIGIGAAICRALAGDGIDIAFTHWQPYDDTMPWKGDPDGPSRLLDELRAMGVNAIAIEADTSDPARPAQVFDQVEAELGPVSILVNNAAVSEPGGIEACDAGQLDRHLSVNVRGATLLCRELVMRWPGGEGGRIINLTSGQGVVPMPDELAYALSKGAVEAMTSSLAAGVIGRGITVNAVNPGPVDTGWMTDELKALLLPRFPTGRIGRPEDAARLVRWLASDEAGWITGEVINSEGGFVRS